MTTRFKILCVGLVALGAVGCGRLQDLLPLTPREEPRPTPGVILASDAEIAQGEVEPGSYVVAFRAAPRASFQLFRSFREEYGHHTLALTEAYLADPRVASIRYLTTVNLAHAKDTRGRETIGLPPALHLAWTEDDFDEIPAVLSEVNFASPDAAKDVLGEWETAGDIWFAEPNGLSELSQNDTGSEAYKPYRENPIDWHALIKLSPALEQMAGAGKLNVPRIAILDSGVDYTHPDLKDRIWQRENYKPNETGCGDDRYGCDTTKPTKDQLGVGEPWPYLTTGPGQPCPPDSDPKKTPRENQAEQGTCVHGTHVAGITAATLNLDADGGASGGVCPMCEILPIKIISKSTKGKGQASDAAILAAMKYLTNFKEEGRERSAIRIANSSFGKYTRSRSVALLVRILSAAPHEILVVGAAGNEDTIKRSYPGALEESIGVASVDGGGKGAKSSFSNYGPWVDVAAPGSISGTGGINSTAPGGGYDRKQGTSMACPVVAGLAGLVLALPANQNLGFADLKSRIIATTDPSIYSEQIPGNRAYYAAIRGESSSTRLLGTGLVDAAAAVSGTPSPVQSNGFTTRVDSSCGVIGTRVSQENIYIKWVLLAAPCALVLLSRMRRKTSTGYP